MSYRNNTDQRIKRKFDIKVLKDQFFSDQFLKTNFILKIKDSIGMLFN